MRTKHAILILAAWRCLAQQTPSPAATEAVAPVYPELAVTGRVSGSVIVEVRVSPGGAVESVSVAGGEALLRQASVDAARLWRFEPQPATHGAKLVFSYRLMPKNTPEPELGTVFRPPYTVEVRRATPGPVSHFARNGPDIPRKNPT